MILTTMDHVPGREITEVLGLVRGNQMRGFATILSSFTDPSRLMTMNAELREVEDGATENLIQQAIEMGADAVIGVRISSTAFEYDNALKYQATMYGTAVKLD